LEDSEVQPEILAVDKPVTNAASGSAVRIEGVGSAIWVVTLNRPDLRNAIDDAVQEGILQAVRQASDDAVVRVMVITGAGPAFSAGGDRSLIQRMQEDIEVRTRVLDRSRALFEEMRDLTVPTIAAVNGPAVGAGCSLALLCDIVIMADGASLSDPRVRYGLAPGDGAAILWPLLAGLPAGRAYLLTGDRISAEEAFRIGLIHQVVGSGEAQKTARLLAERIASLPRPAVRATKQAINGILAAAAEPVFEAALAAESSSFDTIEHQTAVGNLAAIVSRSEMHGKRSNE
jgi:enoyl-CoA hydratase/carnithine racemase